MKRRFALLLFALVVSTCHADSVRQERPQKSSVKTLWDYSQQLKITADQTARLKQALAAFQKLLSYDQDRLLAAERKFKQMVMVDESPMSDVQTQLERIAHLQVEMRLAVVKTSRKINEILTPHQLTQWAAIQQAAGHSRAQ